MPYKCPNNCEDSCLYYPPSCLIDPTGEIEHPECLELGILCDEDGVLENTWEDGTRGVPESLESDDCSPYCLKCGEESVFE